MACRVDSTTPQEWRVIDALFGYTHLLNKEFLVSYLAVKE